MDKNEKNAVVDTPEPVRVGEQGTAASAVRFVGEIFLPGASQYLSGNVKSGLTHTVLAGAAGALLVSSGVAPLLGTLAVVGVKLNSYSQAQTGRGILSVGSEMVSDVSDRVGNSAYSRERETRVEEPPAPSKSSKN